MGFLLLLLLLSLLLLLWLWLLFFFLSLLMLLLRFCCRCRCCCCRCGRCGRGRYIGVRIGWLPTPASDLCERRPLFAAPYRLGPKRSAMSGNRENNTRTSGC